MDCASYVYKSIASTILIYIYIYIYAYNIIYIFFPFAGAMPRAYFDLNASRAASSCEPDLFKCLCRFLQVMYYDVLQMV